MPISNRILNGKLNLDVSSYALPKGDYIDAMNISRNAMSGSNDLVISNINGNEAVSYTLPAGVCKRIGSYADVVRNRVYIFIWNSEGHNLWLYYDGGLNTITKILEDLTDTGGIAVLNFNPSKKINHIDVINRDDDGDLVFWTDGNTTPKCANVTRILNGTYTTVKSSFIETAKKPFLTSPVCAYGSDLTRGSNSLRRKLFQFSARPVYDDFQKSTLSTYSKIPLPVGYYGSDNDTETTANNFITVVIETGDEDVAKLEIYMRFNDGNVWSDFLQVASIDKAQIGIADNSTYSFLFYNDGVYPPIAIDDAVRLFDYVPPLADAQSLANGVYPVYSSITDGYNPYPQGQLDVTITAANVTNVPPDTNPPTLVYTSNGTTWTFTVGGVIPTGTVFKILANVPGTGVVVFADYTSIAGNTAANVATGLYAYITAHYPTYTDGIAAPIFYVLPPVPGYYVVGIQVDVIPAGSSISTEKTWLWGCNYIKGIVYFDEQGRDMPGVTNFISVTNTDNDFSVTTPEFSLVGTDVQTPVITATINHIPPEGAVRYCWVRRRQTYGTFLFYETCDFQEEDGYYYLCLGNIAGYKEDNSQFVYGSIPISEDSRIKVIAGVTAGAYNGDIWSQDYQVLGIVTRLMTGGISPANDQPFIKIKIPSSVPSPVYTVNMLVMIYTPMKNPITETDSVYNEWGEDYGIYEIAGVKYHRGKDQDQTASVPATFVWAEGDVYFHTRTMYNTKDFDDDPAHINTLNIMDAGFSDFFTSSVNDNGRPQIVDVNAKRQYNPVLIRHGGAFEAGTNINETNRFDFINFIEADRNKGAIRLTFIDKKIMRLFQQFDVGNMPIFTQIIKDTAGNPLQADSDNLLNTIQYPYIGKFGIGDTPESFAYGKGAMYFADSNKGVVCRLAADGITSISILYQCGNFFVTNLAGYGKGLDNGIGTPGQPYTGNPTAYGVFDSYLNKYIIALEEISRYTPSTTYFSETFTSGIDGGIAYAGTPGTGYTVSVSLLADNGQSLTVSYVILAGNTSTNVRDAIKALINASVTFTASTFNLSVFPGFPTSVGAYKGFLGHNVAGGTTLASCSISGPLYFHQDPYTLTFNETRDSTEGFESFVSNYNEGMVCLNNLLISFKNGGLWKRADNDYCSFFGMQYGASITPVFNDQVPLKKIFETISYDGNKVWTSEVDGDIKVSGVNGQTGLPVISKLMYFNYTIDEGIRTAAFLRDINSKDVALEALYEGDFLVGNYLQTTLRYGGNDFAFLFFVRAQYHLSQKNS